MGVPGLSAYSASKHGVLGLTKSAALEVARDGIRVNAVLPRKRPHPDAAGLRRRRRGAAREDGPAGADGSPGRAEEIAEAIVWLLSDAAGFVTGNALVTRRRRGRDLMDDLDIIVGADGEPRCWWCGDDPTTSAYHDDDWGTPIHDDRALFELLCLEGFQAGLSWITILRKRPAFQAAFEGFDPEVVAEYGDADIKRLLADAGIVRHGGKIEATIANAQAVLDAARRPAPRSTRSCGRAQAHPASAPSTRADILAAHARAAEALSKD